MKERIAKRLLKGRPMVQISIRIPEDVIDDLKMVAEVLGFSGYQPLIRFYIGQGLGRPPLAPAAGRCRGARAPPGRAKL